MRITIAGNHEVDVDPELADLILSKHWGTSDNQYFKTSINGKLVQLHHYILRLNNIIVPSKMIVDHIDGNTLNNKRSNLQVTTYSQNQYKAKMRKDNPYGVKGVRMTRNGKYVLFVGILNSKLNVGTYGSIKQAAFARKVTEQFLTGEYVRLSTFTKSPEETQIALNVILKLLTKTEIFYTRAQQNKIPEHLIGLVPAQPGKCRIQAWVNGRQQSHGVFSDYILAAKTRDFLMHCIKRTSRLNFPDISPKDLYQEIKHIKPNKIVAKFGASSEYWELINSFKLDNDKAA